MSKTKAVNLKDVLAGKIEDEQLQQLSFEQGLALLEELVDQVESGSLPLETAISSYEKGTALLGHLRELLSGAESKLEVLQQSGK